MEKILKKCPTCGNMIEGKEKHLEEKPEDCIVFECPCWYSGIGKLPTET
jgi:hypothetical protein